MRPTYVHMRMRTYMHMHVYVCVRMRSIMAWHLDEGCDERSKQQASAYWLTVWLTDLPRRGVR